MSIVVIKKNLSVAKPPEQSKCFVDLSAHHSLLFKENQNAPRPSEHPSVKGKKIQNV